MSYLANPNSSTSGPFNTDAASHNTGFFSDNTNPSSVNCNVLPAPSSNVIAASGKWDGTGGKRRKSRGRAIASICKCKTCTKHRNKRHLKKCSRKRKTTRRKRRTKRSRGGTTNNVPNTPSYATGTELPYGLSALANPAPYWKIDNSANCTDNYNHFEGGKKRTKRRGTKRRGG